VPARWVWLSFACAAIAGAGSVVGLLASDRIYGQETPAFISTSLAQDIVNLFVASPLIVILGIRVLRGSALAYVCWLGTLAFTAYSYAIYAFSIHFGLLFLLWVAVLGLAFYALVGSLATVDAQQVKDRFAGRALPLACWTLTVLAVLFMLLWLKEIVPDLLAGGASTSASSWNIPTNPVHVLDLAIYLPAVLISASMLQRRRPFGYATAPGHLVFLALTCLPILTTTIVAQARSDSMGWGVVPPISGVLLLTVSVLVVTLRQAGPALASTK
jgi:hypothetical protein